MRIVPDSETEPSVGGESVNVLVGRAAVAYSEGRRDDCAADVRQLAAALDGPYFSFLRAVQSTVDDLIGTNGSLQDPATRRLVVAETVHRMVFVRSELLSRQMQADGTPIAGYDARSDAARILGPEEQVPEGWAVHQQGLPNGDMAPTAIFVAYDPTRVMEPVVALDSPSADVLGIMYERGFQRVAGDVDCRVFAAPLSFVSQASPEPVAMGDRDDNVELGL